MIKGKSTAYPKLFKLPAIGEDTLAIRDDPSSYPGDNSHRSCCMNRVPCTNRPFTLNTWETTLRKKNIFISGSMRDEFLFVLSKR